MFEINVLEISATIPFFQFRCRRTEVQGDRSNEARLASLPVLTLVSALILFLRAGLHLFLL